MKDSKTQAQAILEWRKRNNIQISEDDRKKGVRLLSLAEYVEEAWRVVEPTTEYKHNWHIDAICDHLQACANGQIQNLIINIPPRHSKSLIVSVFFMTWLWTFDPSKRFLYASYGEDLAIRDSLACRRIIKSQWYQTHWGKVFKLTGDQNKKKRFENSETGFRLATSVGGVGTGEGGDVIVIDDPHKADEAESDIVREGVLNWWDQTMSTRLNDPITGNRIIIMQRVHDQDLCGHLIDKMKSDDTAANYELLILPAEYDGNKRKTSLGFQDPREEVGELLNPVRFNKQTINNLKASLGSYGASGQLQQEPAPPGGGIFKRKWWKFWYYPHSTPKPWKTSVGDGQVVIHDQVPMPHKLDMVSQSWDCAFKDAEDSDFVVGQCWAKKAGNFYLLDQHRERMDLIATMTAIENMSNAFPESTSKYVEDKANGPAVISTLKGRIPGLIAVNPEGDKETRARAVAPFCESGNVYLPHPSIAPWVKEFMTRFAKFPRVAWDDEIDAFSQMLIKWTKGQRPDGAIRNYMMVDGFEGGNESNRRYPYRNIGAPSDYGIWQGHGRRVTNGPRRYRRKQKNGVGRTAIKPKRLRI